MHDCYPEAAIRHYLDGTLLCQANRYDNAMCHYAFSVECAIKAFVKQFQQIYPVPYRNPIHDVTENLESLSTYHELLGILNPQLSLLIGVDAPPPLLFQDHPGRRYRNDLNYTATEINTCAEYTAQMTQQIISAAIDGKLNYQIGSEPL